MQQCNIPLGFLVILRSNICTCMSTSFCFYEVMEFDITTNRNITELFKYYAVVENCIVTVNLDLFYFNNMKCTLLLFISK